MSGAELGANQWRLLVLYVSWKDLFQALETFNINNALSYNQLQPNNYFWCFYTKNVILLFNENFSSV